MNHSYDLLVVGGGVIGCSVAFQSAKKGAKVMVVQKGPIGGEAAALTAGILAAQADADEPGPLFDLGRASAALFPQQVEEVRELSGIDPEFEPTGVWAAASTQEGKDRLLDKMRWQQERSLAVEWLEPAALKDVHPGLGENIGAAYFPGDAHIDGGFWTLGLAEASRRKGVRFLDQASSLEFLRERRRVSGVRTGEETLLADQVVLAAGAWTPRVLDALRISIPLEPVKGQLMVLAGVPRAFRGPVYAGAGYLIPRSDGRLVVGTTYERAGYDTRPTLDAQRFLADWATRWCPGLRDLPVVDFQAGLRPGTPDGGPLMGRLWDYDNLFIASGHYKSGILLSAFTGRYMADGILAGRWDPLGAPFLPERFREKPS